MHNRTITQRLQHKAASRFGRITVLTGARQTGKTTLVRALFPDYTYLTLDDPITRPDYARLSAAQWQERYPLVILDEVQKLPALLDSVKATYDQYPDTRYILLGSSQILLLEKVQESLAGRAALIELYSLTLPERQTTTADEAITPSRLVRLLMGEPASILQGIPLTDTRYAKAENAWADYLEYGAMPAIVDSSVEKSEKREWLQDYIRTYLQRDVRDLGNMRELEPFVRAQKALAALSGQLLNVSELAKQAGISAVTAKRFISYLEISYQAIQLAPWFRNLHKRLSKSPKVHFLDPGIQRVLLNRTGTFTGHEFESAVVAEIYKQIKTHALAVDCYHLRTVDGREVDLLLELENGYIAIEVKMSAHVSATDARHLHDLAELLDKPLLHALVVSNDPQVQQWGNVMAVPVAWLLG
ncbi:ATP-binding protein [Thiothrix subterranea]|uniref:ATP-binding protein n=1 Tax=Thiothrix subterranea TaxID=2735563 RepID=A0AA51R0I0_9GAMM|nr:ATP-binding protein [Thiothrix subterranea]MDQ5767096.1 ATP-binding protein [Thiothrix subterranea]WML88042.1 ATP-binding protein [Thiothrix subterranea]